jgi:pyridoxal phosphate enzyme (YggS family)
MDAVEQALQAVLDRVAAAERRFGRPAGSVALLAVSKTRDAGQIGRAAALGQRDFGENYLQEALPKMAALVGAGLTWHFIGRVQSNKTADIAARFDWVHTVDRDKIARRLNEQRPERLPPLNVCVEVNVSGEASKSGVAPNELGPLLACIAAMPRLHLRGLMTLPRPEADFGRQRLPFRELAALLATHRERYGLDTLSMGTTADMEAAIAEGATWVRIGTAIFGPRQSVE